MVSGVSSSSTSSVQQYQKPDETKMFSDLSSKVGADSSGITKDDLESYLKTLKSSSSSDSKETSMISKMVDNFDSLSGGTDTITSDSFKTGMQSMKPQGGPGGPDGSGGPGGNMFSDLSTKVGADSKTGITKDELQTYLKKLQSSSTDSTDSSTSSTSSSSTTDTSKDIKIVSDMISNFDSVSGGASSITSDSFNSYVQNKMKKDGNEPQDPSTVTSDQLQSPIDIRV